MRRALLPVLTFPWLVASAWCQGLPEPTSRYRLGDALVELQDGGAAVSRDGGITFVPLPATDDRLFLRSGVFDPLLGAPSFDERLQAPANAGIFAVQMRTAILPEHRATLVQKGLEVLGYWPKNCYLVRGSRAVVEGLSALPFVRWTGPVALAQKIDPALHGLVLAGGEGERRECNVVLGAKSDRERLLAQIAAIGGELMNANDGSIYVIARLSPAQLLQVAGLDTVLWIDEASAIEFDMDNARIQGGGNYVEAMAGYTGLGVRAEISEGLDQTHPDWTNPILVRFDTTDSHGHCTAGIVGGNGSGNAAARGMIPDAQLIESSVGAWAGLSRFLVTQGSVDPAGPIRAMQQTASWGSARVLDYTSISADLDDALFTFDFVLTQSQSNSGTQLSRPQAWAKNVISVGGVRHVNNSNPADDFWQGASIGPAADGRIKPEICAYYDSVLCADRPGVDGYSTTDYYSSFNGTSAATPIVNGHVGIIQQMFTDGLFGNPLPLPATPANRFDNRPHASTVKSLLVSSANSYPFSGAADNLTRVHQGWGFPDLRRLYDDRERIVVVDEYAPLQQGQTRTHYVWVRPGAADFRASMTYADPAAVPGTLIHRINSVDLGVREYATGTQWWGNNGLDVGNVSSPGGAPNDLDTTENVWLSAPASGIYEVTVAAPTIVQDARSETPGVLDVDYALVMHPVGGGYNTASPMQLDLIADFPGQLGLSLTGVPQGWTEGFTFLSLATAGPKGFGGFFGVERDFLVDTALTEPAIPGGVLHFTNAGPNIYPNGQFYFPAQLVLALSGITVDAMVTLFDGAGQIVEQSNVARVTLP